MRRVAFIVESVQGPAFVQDGGRRGSMHHGVPPGGALVPELLAAAQRSLGNAWHVPAIECFGAITIRAGGSALRVSLDGCVTTIEPHASFAARPAPAHRVRYLAVEGGLDVPTVLGGHGTLALAGVGGLDGRALRRGDELGVHARDERTPLRTIDPASFLSDRSPLRIVAGPDRAPFDRDVLRALTSASYVVSAASDRVGYRLDGPPIARLGRDDAGSRPMVRGAIEVPAGGAPIVLGPDHPTTGGYPVVAVLARVDHGRFAARRPGTSIRFVEISIDDARSAWRAHAAHWFADVSDAL